MRGLPRGLATSAAGPPPNPVHAVYSAASVLFLTKIHFARVDVVLLGCLNSQRPVRPPLQLSLYRNLADAVWSRVPPRKLDHPGCWIHMKVPLPLSDFLDHSCIFQINMELC